MEDFVTVIQIEQMWDHPDILKTWRVVIFGHWSEYEVLAWDKHDALEAAKSVVAMALIREIGAS